MFPNNKRFIKMMNLKNMKIVSVVLALGLFSATANADSLKDLFGKIKGSDIADVAGQFMKKDLTASDLEGTWTTNAPAVLFKSNDAMQNAGGIALSKVVEKKLLPLYTKIGVDKAVMVIDAEGEFTLTVKGYDIKGTLIDMEGNMFELKLGQSETSKKIGKDSKLILTAEKTTKGLALAADASKLVEILNKISSKTDKKSIKAAMNVLNSYDQVCIGYRFVK